MQIGRRIFYSTVNGDLIAEIMEREGPVTPTTVEQDIASFTVLSERSRDSFGVIDLEYGQLARDFAGCRGYRVNLEKLAQLPAGEEWKAIEFSYPDPNNPEADPVYVPPITEELATVKAELQTTQDELKTAQTEIVTTNTLLLEFMEATLLG